jgi:hypothetical protein
MTSAKTDVTVVLVHAAWADGSSWNRVTEEVQRKGIHQRCGRIFVHELPRLASFGGSEQPVSFPFAVKRSDRQRNFRWRRDCLVRTPLNDGKEKRKH